VPAGGAGDVGRTPVGAATGWEVGVIVMVDSVVVGTQVVTVMTEVEYAGGEETLYGATLVGTETGTGTGATVGTETTLVVEAAMGVEEVRYGQLVTVGAHE
jgi:hypothetical protein